MLTGLPVVAQNAPSGPPPGALMVATTEGKGPGERVIAFAAAPDAARAALPDAAVRAAMTSLGAEAATARAEAELELGLTAVGDSIGTLGLWATMVEHGLFIAEFAPVNNALTNIGGVFALAQVSRDVWNGQNDAALADGIKGWLGFAASKWGWGALQIGSAAMFIVDATLREWQKGLVEIASEGLWCPYIAWYHDHGRPVSAWKKRAWDLFLQSERDGQISFADALDDELDSYLRLAFDDPMWITAGDCGTSTMGLGHAPTEAKLTAAYKGMLSAMLAQKVLPEIGERAWRRNLDAQIDWANTHLVPRLNATLTLEITAYGAPEGSRVVMPLPAGGTWGGKLRPEGTFKAQITRYALARAGFPDTVRLEGGAQPEERRLMLAEGRLTAMFGTPETPLVSRYRLTEQPGSCAIARIAPDGSRQDETATAEARPAQDLDMAMLPGGGWVMGAFRPEGGWSVASPGLADAGGRLTFGAPLWDGITGFSGCQMGFLTDDSVAQADCRVERSDSKQVSARTRIDRRCTAPARLELIGVHTAMMGGEMTYYDLDGPQGKILADVLRQSINRGVVGGMAGLPGMGGN